MLMLGEKSVEISNPTVVQSTKYCQQKDRYNIDCFVKTKVQRQGSILAKGGK